jgi:Uma2 family endonuclease
MGNTVRNIEPYTYQEYQKLPEGVRLEILDGVVYDMAASPSAKHQRVVLNFGEVVNRHFRGKGCTPFIAPMDVVLDDINVVEPDVFIVCDSNKITEANIKGAPDLIVEVLSPSTGVRDRRSKKKLYQNHGVREYLIASPMEETVERFYLKQDGSYGESELFAWHESFASLLFPELMFDLRVIFEKEDVVESVADPNVPEWLKEKLNKAGEPETK